MKSLWDYNENRTKELRDLLRVNWFIFIFSRYIWAIAIEKALNKEANFDVFMK
jgi:hypothetical protein